MNNLSPRPVAAWALVGYAGLHLFFAFADWVVPGNGTIIDRSVGAGFTDLLVMAMPVVAVLLTVHLTPVLSQARTIVVLALVEYGASVVFGLLAFLLGLGTAIGHTPHSPNDAFDSLRHFVMGGAGVLLIAAGGFITYREFVRLGGSVPIRLNRPGVRR